MNREIFLNGKLFALNATFLLERGEKFCADARRVLDFVGEIFLIDRKQKHFKSKDEA
jgi:hypothetical protein